MQKFKSLLVDLQDILDSLEYIVRKLGRILVVVSLYILTLKFLWDTILSSQAVPEQLVTPIIKQLKGLFL